MSKGGHTQKLIVECKVNEKTITITSTRSGESARLPISLSSVQYRQQSDIHSYPQDCRNEFAGCAGCAPLGRLHVDYRQYQNSDPKKFEEYLKFTVVRSPVSRMYSAFMYMTNGGNKDEHDLKTAAFLASNCKDFSAFVALVADQQLHTLWPMLWPQSAFVCDALGTLMVDLVLRQEYIDTDYETLRRRRPILPEYLPKLNTMDSGGAVCPSQETVRRIMHLYVRDYLIFYPGELSEAANETSGNKHGAAG